MCVYALTSRYLQANSRSSRAKHVIFVLVCGRESIVHAYNLQYGQLSHVHCRCTIIIARDCSAIVVGVVFTGQIGHSRNNRLSIVPEFIAFTWLDTRRDFVEQCDGLSNRKNEIPLVNSVFPRPCLALSS